MTRVGLFPRNASTRGFLGVFLTCRKTGSARNASRINVLCVRVVGGRTPDFGRFQGYGLRPSGPLRSCPLCSLPLAATPALSALHYRSGRRQTDRSRGSAVESRGVPRDAAYRPRQPAHTKTHTLSGRHSPNPSIQRGPSPLRRKPTRRSPYQANHPFPPLGGGRPAYAVLFGMRRPSNGVLTD